MKLEKLEYYLEWIFKIGLLVYSMLSFNSLCYGKIIISLVMWPVIMCGGILLLLKIRNWKQYVTVPSLLMLAGFIVSYIISAVVNIEYGYKNGIVKLCFLVFYFFILYAKKKGTDTKDVNKEFCVLSWILTLYMCISVLISFGLMIVGYTTVETIENGWDIGIGFLWGRLWGIFTEPNYAAVCASVVIIMSFYLYKRYQNKKLRAFLVFNDILLLFYIAFTDSRTGRIALAVGLTIFVFNYLNYQRLYVKNKKIKLWTVIIASFLVAIVSFSMPKGITTVYNEIMESRVGDSGGKIVDRGYDLTEDVSNRRFDIWKSGMEVFSTTPLVGTSYTNILPYTLENCEDTYLVNNSAEKNFSSIHNEVLNILVGQGLLGIIAFAIFLVWVVVKYVKNYFKLNIEAAFFHNIMISCCLVATACAMFLTGMFYSNSPAVVIFWICLGNFMLCVEQKEPIK